MNMKNRIPYFFLIAPLIFQKLIWIPTRLLLVVCGHVRREGLEHLKGIPHNAIFAMNHSSEIDPFIVPASLPFFSRFSPLFYATKQKSFYDTNGWRQHLFGGFFIQLWGGQTVHSGLHDYKKSLAQHTKLLDVGKSFCVFPEGGITRDGLLQPAHGGIAFLADYGQCPIVPVAVVGAYKMSMEDFFKGRRTITVRFGKPIFQEEFKLQVGENQTVGENMYKKQAQYVMKKIGEMMG